MELFFYIEVINNMAETIEEKLRRLGQEKAKKYAKEARDKLSKEYADTIEAFYGDYDPEPAYLRNYKLRKSYIPHYKDNGHGVTFWGGVEIGAMKMSDYPIEKGIRNQPISAENLFNSYIYNGMGNNSTFHGGNYHGGYGKQASFSIYEHMHEYHEKLKEEYRKILEK